MVIVKTEDLKPSKNYPLPQKTIAFYQLSSIEELWGLAELPKRGARLSLTRRRLACLQNNLEVLRDGVVSISKITWV